MFWYVSLIYDDHISPQIIRKRFIESKPVKSTEIDLVGFRNMFSELDQTVSKSVVTAAFKQFDTRKAGSLSFRDICFGLATSCISSWDVRAGFLFSWFDADNSGYLSKDQVVSLLTSVVCAVRRAVDSGDSNVRFPLLIPPPQELVSPRVSSAPFMDAEGLERIQSCVTAIQSEVYSTVHDNQSWAVGHPDLDLTDNERAWVEQETETLLSGKIRIEFDSDFLPWSVRNCHFLYKLLELFELVPSPDRERRTCMSILRQATPTPGSTWYVVSYKWMQLWKAYVHWPMESDSIASPSSARSDGGILHAMSTMDALSCTSTVLQQRMSERPLSINNSDLEGELKGALRANLVERHDYLVVPEEMWRHLFEWYGGGPVLPRKVASFKMRKLSSMAQNSTSHRHVSTTIELYPPLILVVMCGSNGLPVKHFTKRFFVSRADTCRDLIGQLSRKLLNKDDPSLCRLWHRRSGEVWELLARDDPRRIDDFVDSVSTEAGTFMLEVVGRDGAWPREGLRDDASHAMNELQVGDRVDGKRNCEWRHATVVDVAEGSVKVHFDGEQYKNDAWLSCDSDEIAPYGVRAEEGILGNTLHRSKFFWRKKVTPKPVPPPSTRRGATGLENIGNTCFMNATLQCLSSTPMLKEYFVSNAFQKHLRSEARVAGEFASLLAAMWKGTKGFVAPTAFKKALEKFAPRFVGYEHQDAHELLAVLLDGIHEDLNTGIVAAAVGGGEGDADNVESDGLTEWARHRSLNTSVIADLFDGQQKISTECKSCGHKCANFEAFRYVMLPVPVTEHRQMSVYFMPCPSSSTPRPKVIKFSVTVHKSALVQSLINALSSNYPAITTEYGIDWEGGTVMAEVYLSRIHRFIDCSSSICEFRSDDKLFVFQTPVSSGSSDTGDGAVFAQIVHRREVVTRRQRRTVTRREVFGLPSVMSVNARWTGHQLHAVLKSHLARFVSTSAPRYGAYTVRITSPDGSTCSACGKASGEGCPVPASGRPVPFKGSWLYLAIDWHSSGFYDTESETPVMAELLTCPPVGNPTHMVAVSHNGGGRKGRTSGPSLYDCLDAYTATEQLMGDNQWACDKCGEKRDAERKTRWWVAPDVLVVLLKRFQFTAAGFEKIGVPISFPISDLHLRTATEETYDLYGVVNHYGSLSAGHYTALCREDDAWFLFNDHQVLPVLAEEIAQEIQNCAKSCYVLFYKRKGTRPANVINYGRVGGADFPS